MSFTTLALKRLAECLRLDVTLHDAPEGEPLTAEIAMPDGISPWHINDSTHLLWGFSDSPQYGYLGLVELAAASGYIDLADCRGTAVMERAAKKLSESAANQTAIGGGVVEDPRLGLITKLASRLANPLRNAPATDSVTFNAFESYLSLTASVFADQPLIEALQFTHEGWTPAADRAALLTPRHMADALVTGHVGAVSVRGIAGLPSSIDAYEWLAAIVTRLKDRPEFCDSLLQHARWSHAAWVTRQRADEWALAMSEWGGHRDLEGEAHWQAFRERVFLRLEAEQKRLNLETTGNSNVTAVPGAPLMWTAEVPAADVEDRVTELLAVGREDAARRLLRVALDGWSRAAPGEQGKAAAAELVRFARRLSELDDVDSAAAFVLPQLAFIIETVGREDETTAYALEVVARARRDVVKAPASAKQDVRLKRILETPNERPRLRSYGETE